MLYITISRIIPDKAFGKQWDLLYDSIKKKVSNRPN